MVFPPPFGILGFPYDLLPKFVLVLVAEEVDQSVSEAVFVYFVLQLLLAEGMQQVDAFQLVLLQQQRDGFLQKGDPFVEVDHIQDLTHCLSRLLSLGG